MVAVPRNKLNFPTSMKTTLRYVSRIDMQPTSTAVVFASYRANGMFDPEVTLGGHQPRGFDEFMNVYSTYTVTGAKVSVNFMYEGYDGPSTTATAGNLVKNSGADSSEPPALTPIACGLHKSVVAIGAGNAEQQMERDKTSWTFLTGQGETKSLSTSATVQEFYGKQALVGSVGYTGSAVQDPSEPVYFHVWAGRVSNDFAAEKTKVVAYVTITYDAVFTEPKNLNAS